MARVTWIKRRIAEMILRDTGITIDPASIIGINRGFWYAYPEAYRWCCEEIDSKNGKKRIIACNASMSFCMFLGGFEPELEQDEDIYQIFVHNTNKKTPYQIEMWWTDRGRPRRRWT